MATHGFPQVAFRAMDGSVFVATFPNAHAVEVRSEPGLSHGGKTISIELNAVMRLDGAWLATDRHVWIHDTLPGFGEAVIPPGSEFTKEVLDDYVPQAVLPALRRVLASSAPQRQRAQELLMQRRAKPGTGRKAFGAALKPPVDMRTWSGEVG